MDERRLIYLVIRTLMLLAIIYHVGGFLAGLSDAAVALGHGRPLAAGPDAADPLAMMGSSILCGALSFACFHHARKLVSWIDGPPQARP